MRFLFFPGDLGGGFGHISRCLELAYKAKEKGHTCAFVLNTSKYILRISKAFQVYKSYPSENIFSKILSLGKHFKKPPEISPLFREFSGVAYQVIRDGYMEEATILNKLEQYENIVNKFKPHILIGDINLLTGILSQKTSIPLVQIIRYGMHPETANLIWWKDIPQNLVIPDTTLLFNPLLNKLGLKEIEITEDLLRGDLYIIPSIPEIEPVSVNENNIHVGQLSLSEKTENIPEWINYLDKDKPLIYITIGGGAGAVGCNNFFSTVIKAFTDKPVQVIISTTSGFDYSRNNINLPGNIKIFKWVPGKLIISKSNLVIFHGGYGTMMEVLLSGKPSIVIPFQSEQESNGRRLEQLRCGKLLKLSKENLKVIESKWKYGNFNYLVQTKFDLSPEELYGQVEEVLYDNEFRNYAEIIKSKIEKYNGAEMAVDKIDKFIGR